MEERSANHVVGNAVGEAAGGISGGLTGAAIGSLGGPIGTIIGGIAGALSGWWAGHAIAEAAQRYDAQYDDTYRRHYAEWAGQNALRSYEDVRPAYKIGYLAGQNPEWRDRSFAAVDPELGRGWAQLSAGHGDWAHVRDLARDAFDRARLGQPPLSDQPKPITPETEA